MQDRPTADEILSAVAECLRGEQVSAFERRVAANALELVRRELALPGAEERAQHDALRALLGADGAVEELTAELARRIRQRDLTPETAGLVDLLWRLTDAKLAVDQPQHAGFRRAQALRAARKQES